MKEIVPRFSRFCADVRLLTCLLPNIPVDFVIVAISSGLSVLHGVSNKSALLSQLPLVHVRTCLIHVFLDLLILMFFNAFCIKGDDKQDASSFPVGQHDVSVHSSKFTSLLNFL